MEQRFLFTLLGVIIYFIGYSIGANFAYKKAKDRAFSAINELLGDILPILTKKQVKQLMLVTKTKLFLNHKGR